MAQASTHDFVLDLWHWDPGRVAAAAFELSRLPKAPRDVPAKLRRLLSHSSEIVREAAAEAAGKLCVKKAVPELVRLVRDGRQPLAVRDTAAYALSLLGDDAAFAPLYLVAREVESDAKLRSLYERAVDALWALR